MIDLIIADLENPAHAAAILTVLNDYASDPAGAVGRSYQPMYRKT